MRSATRAASWTSATAAAGASCSAPAAAAAPRGGFQRLLSHRAFVSSLPSSSFAQPGLGGRRSATLSALPSIGATWGLAPRPSLAATSASLPSFRPQVAGPSLQLRFGAPKFMRQRYWDEIKQARVEPKEKVLARKHPLYYNQNALDRFTLFRDGRVMYFPANKDNPHCNRFRRYRKRKPRFLSNAKERARIRKLCGYQYAEREDWWTVLRAMQDGPHMRRFDASRGGRPEPLSTQYDPTRRVDTPYEALLRRQGKLSEGLPRPTDDAKEMDYVANRLRLYRTPG